MTNDETLVFLDAPPVTAQGDLYFVALPRLPRSAKDRKSRQLAEGDTQGSRHMLTIGDVFDADAAEVAAMIEKSAGVKVDARYIGPVFRSADARAYVEHPEHGDHDYQCETVRATVYQRSLDAEEREQRVRD